MKRPKTIIGILIFILGSIGVFQPQCFAQYQAYLGINTAWNSSFFQIRPENDVVGAGSIFSPLVLGGKVDIRISDSPNYLELSGYWYNQFLKFKPLGIKDMRTSNFSYLSVFGIGYKRKKTVLPGRIFLYAHAGLEMAWNDARGKYGSFVTIQNSDTLIWQIESDLKEDAFVPMVYGGIGTEIHMRNGMFFSINGTYHQGLKKMTEGVLRTALNNNPPEETNWFSRGSHFMIQLGLSYPISRIWEEKKELFE